METIPDARHIARGAAIVIARDQTLLFVSYSDWSEPPYHELAWPEPILAIAAKDMFVAVADRVRAREREVVLGTRTGPKFQTERLTVKPAER